MIELYSHHGSTRIKIEGNVPGLLVDLSIVTGKVLKRIFRDCPLPQLKDELTKCYFEMVLHELNEEDGDE